MTKQTRAGGCLCGALRYTIETDATGFGACHCGMCRRWSGGIHLGLQAGSEGIAVDDDSQLETYKSSDWAERTFCRTCGTHLTWRMTAPGPLEGMTMLSVGTLDNLDGLRLDSEIYVDHKPDAYSFADDTKKMTEAELMAMISAAGQGAQE